MKLDDREHLVAYEKARAALLTAQIDYKTLSEFPDVAQVDSVALREKLAAAVAKLKGVEERFGRGELNYDDYLRLRRECEVDIAYYNAHRGDVIASKSGLAQAREAFERAKMNLEWTEVRAPFAGYVADCELSPAMQVQAGRVLLKVVDVSSLLVDVAVLESEIGRIGLNARAEVRVNAFPEESFLGTVVAMNPIVDAKSKAVKVTVELKDARPKKRDASLLLRPGMFATVKLEAERFANRLLVPKEALLVRDQRTLVFVMREGLAKWHYVEVGEENEELLEVKSGILVGDT